MHENYKMSMPAHFIVPMHVGGIHMWQGTGGIQPPGGKEPAAVCWWWCAHARNDSMVVMHRVHAHVVGSGRERSRQAVVVHWWAQHGISSCARTR
jgi:hypothetical protein